MLVAYTTPSLCSEPLLWSIYPWSNAPKQLQDVTRVLPAGWSLSLLPREAANKCRRESGTKRAPNFHSLEGFFQSNYPPPHNSVLHLIAIQFN
jgi:hypothetical protein